MEKNDKIEPINYFREAFLHPFNLVFVGILGVFIFLIFSENHLWRETLIHLLKEGDKFEHYERAYRIKSMIEEMILSFGFGIEMLYLGLVSTSDFFRNLMKKKFAHEINILNEELNIAHYLSKLNKEYLKRFSVFNQKKKMLIERSIENGATTEGILPVIQENVEKLLKAYAQVLYANQLYENHLKTVDNRQLQMELFYAEQEHRQASGKKKELLEQQITLLKSRIEKLHHTSEIFSTAEIQLKNMEYTLDMLYENAITTHNLNHMKETIDSIYQETDAYQDAMHEVLSLNTTLH